LSRTISEKIFDGTKLQQRFEKRIHLWILGALKVVLSKTKIQIRRKYSNLSRAFFMAT